MFMVKLVRKLLLLPVLLALFVLYIVVASIGEVYGIIHSLFWGIMVLAIILTVCFGMWHQVIGFTVFMAMSMVIVALLEVMHAFLRGTMESFRRVLGSGVSYGILSGNREDIDADYIFTTVSIECTDDDLNMGCYGVLTNFSEAVVIVAFFFLTSYISITGAELGNEKGNHLIEGILAAIPAKKHFAGKMLGIGFLVGLQLLIYSIIGSLAYLLLKHTKYLQHIDAGYVGIVTSLTVFSLAAYIFLAACFASFVS